MADFTPGNWWVAPPIFDGDVIYAPPQEKGRRNEVVAIGILNKADARLIAAAPEMYEAIRNLVAEDSIVDTSEKLLDAFLELKMLLARIDGGTNVQTQESAP